MREYRVRVYDDHYLVTDESVGVGTKVVEYGGLEASVAPALEKTAAKVKKTRKPRGPNKPKAEASPAQV